ncbi:MAG: DUF485 domain-containing protein [Thermodesulfovibrionaceae bacterium]|uniref:DUF485 domain-containing protein n=1 Tax=Candidatus Caldatribacterium sp. TaxID=2282143 RepID=UPI0031FA9082|nr:DUF485 domain-containing protein [Candidatus Caldatribacterium sp.]
MNEILNSKEFKNLVKSKNTVAAILTFVELILYFGFILLMAYGKEILSKKIYGSITVGIPVGIGVIIGSWFITGIFVMWSNKIYDKKVSEIREKAEV